MVVIVSFVYMVVYLCLFDAVVVVILVILILIVIIFIIDADRSTSMCFLSYYIKH